MPSTRLAIYTASSNIWDDTRIKVAISNHRTQSVENGTVTFEYKDYRKAGEKGIMEP